MRRPRSRLALAIDDAGAFVDQIFSTRRHTAPTPPTPRAGLPSNAPIAPFSPNSPSAGESPRGRPGRFDPILRRYINPTGDFMPMGPGAAGRISISPRSPVQLTPEQIASNAAFAANASAAPPPRHAARRYSPQLPMGPGGAAAMAAAMNAPPEGESSIDPRFIDSLIGHESSGDTNARPRDPETGELLSTAVGHGQFIESTWLDMLRRHGDEYGLPHGLSRQQQLALRTDPRWSRLMTTLYAEENVEVLRSSTGREPSHADTYLAHFLSPQVASRMINASNNGRGDARATDFVSPEAATQNRWVFFDRNGRPRSVDAVRQLQARNFQYEGNESITAEPQGDAEGAIPANPAAQRLLYSEWQENNRRGPRPERPALQPGDYARSYQEGIDAARSGWLRGNIAERMRSFGALAMDAFLPFGRAGNAIEAAENNDPLSAGISGVTAALQTAGLVPRGAANTVTRGAGMLRSNRALTAAREAEPGSVVNLASGADRESLPLDPASRMQRADEQGFTRPVYHATTRDVNGAFRRSGSGALGPGVYVAERPPTTEVFAGTPRGHDADGRRIVDFAPGANIMPLRARGRMATEDQWENAVSDAARRMRVDTHSSEAQDAAVEALRGEGFAGASPPGRDFHNYFDGRNLRSTSADFDPARTDENNILASAVAREPIGATVDDAVKRVRSLIPSSRRTYADRDLVRPEGYTDAEWADIEPRLRGAEIDLRNISNETTDVNNLVRNRRGQLVDRDTGRPAFTEQAEHGYDIRPGWEDGPPVTQLRSDAVALRTGPTSTIAHSHPSQIGVDGAEGIIPLSPQDLGIVAEPNGPQLITSIEPGGGRGFAARGRWRGGGEGTLARAREAAEQAAGRGGARHRSGPIYVDALHGDAPEAHMDALSEGPMAAPLALGEALRRQRILSRFGYRPGNRAQADTVHRITPTIRRAQRAAYRSLHDSIHGLPWPLTPARIVGGGAAGGFGLNELNELLNTPPERLTKQR